MFSFTAGWSVLLYMLPLLAFFIYFLSFLRLKKWFKILAPSKVLRRNLTKSRRVLVKLVIKGILAAILVFLVLFANTSPVREKHEIVPVKEPFEIVFAVDASLSSLTRDCVVIEDGEEVKVSRLDIMKRGMIKAVRLLEEDKVGLLLFTNKAVPILPVLTTDYENAFVRIVEDISEDYIRLLGGDTDLASAFVEGLSMFSQKEEDKNKEKTKKIFVIFTDAEEEAVAPGVISPGLAQAIQEYSQEENISIYLVGVGDPTKASKIEKGINNKGQMEYYLKPNGEPLRSRPDTKKLASIAARTGGKYIHSQSGDELAQVFEEIITQERVISGYEEKVVLENMTGSIFSIMLIIAFIFLFL